MYRDEIIYAERVRRTRLGICIKCGRYFARMNGYQRICAACATPKEQRPSRCVVCRRCKSSFTTTHKSIVHCEACRREKRVQPAKDGLTKCARCGDVYVRKYTSSPYCLSCRELRRDERRQPKKKTCVSCHAEFECATGRRYCPDCRRIINSARNHD